MNPYPDAISFFLGILSVLPQPVVAFLVFALILALISFLIYILRSL